MGRRWTVATVCEVCVSLEYRRRNRMRTKAAGCLLSFLVSICSSLSSVLRWPALLALLSAVACHASLQFCTLLQIRTLPRDGLYWCVTTVVTYGILLDGLCDNGEVEEALEILEKVHNCKIDLGIGIYNIIIQGMCNASKVDDAWDLFCSLPSKGAKPDVKTYNVMIGGLCRKSSLCEADALFRKMKEDGYEPSDCTYNTLIKAHLQVGDLTTSAKLIEERKSCGLSSDASNVKLVMDMLSSGEIGLK